MRILVAEDERITRASRARQLSAWGHEVTAVEDGERAWTEFNAGAYDIVLTDWEMPGASGIELVRRIRERASAGSAGSSGGGFVYVIMLTSRSDKSDVVRGIESGADDFLAKPFDREELRVRLLAGERIVRLERKLSLQNAELRAASERMRNDLEAAQRVQQAMLPQQDVVTPRVRTAWKYLPTEELAGDAIGLHLIDERYLVAYVLDVSGHGVPAALLAVSAMHELSPLPGGASLLCDKSATRTDGPMSSPAHIVRELNRRFRSEASAGRFLTLSLVVLDTFEGCMRFSSAGHPLPLVLRGASDVPLPDVGGLPLAVMDDAEYDDAAVTLEPGDRVYLYSDGIIEQFARGSEEQFGMARLQRLLAGDAPRRGDAVVTGVIDTLTNWAGRASFDDDVSIVLVEWTGPSAVGTGTVAGGAQ